MLKIDNLKIPDIKPFSFELSKNGLYGLIGRNGIGKSTLFSVLSGEIAVSQGRIESGSVAYLPGVDNFDENLKAADYYAVLSIAERIRAMKLAKLFSADKFADKRIGKYSLGMRELFATILTFSVNSDVLIIDELFSGLDVAVKAKVYEVVRKISAQKIVILTSHHLKEIEHFCDETYLLSESGISKVEDFDVAAREIGYIETFY
jgi:ABC-2 type transport system ATP-binding protein